jgi:hypothetical protein|tara:strand:+ start:100 stop:1470 length:1371 start_codon:yes stop_codon:yes gene_type:complete
MADEGEEHGRSDTLPAIEIPPWVGRARAAAGRLESAPTLGALILASSLTGLVAVYVASVYCRQYTFAGLLSFRPYDPPTPMPGWMYPEPFGVHFFGDFLLPLRHSELALPYDTPGMVPSYYPLFAKVVLKPFLLFDYRQALVLFLLVTFVGLLAPIWAMLAHRPISERLFLTLPLLVTGPMIVVFDRGNLQGLVAAAALIGMVGLLRGNNTAAGFWFGIAAAMKAYPVLLLLLLVRVRDWRAVAVGLVTGAVATFGSLLFFDGGAIGNLQALWRTTDAFRDINLDRALTGNHSFKGGFAAMMVNGPDWLHGSSTWVYENYGAVSVVLTIALVALAGSRTTSLLGAVTYLTVVMSFGVGVSYGYVPIMMLLAVIVVYAGQLERNVPTACYLLVLALLLAPKGVMVGSSPLALHTYLSPLLATVLVGLVLPGDVRRLCSAWRARRSRTLGGRPATEPA